MKTLDQIAAELQGYDPNALRADDVNAFLARMVQPVQQTERLNIFDALGRVFADDLISTVNVPPHDNSAMDGFAFSGHQLLAGAPLVLRVAGTALAGAAWRGTVGDGECLKVMTGAVLPKGLDTVVPQEFAKASGSGEASIITIAAGLLKTGDNRRLAGEDIQAGKAALRRGTRLSPAALGLVASLGVAEVTVWRKLRVAYFSTGDEILSLGEPAREGAVYDSNRYTVFGLLARLGVQMIDMGVVRDDEARLEAAFTRAATEADAIITSGGVSVGEADHTKAMMKKTGWQHWRCGVLARRHAARPADGGGAHCPKQVNHSQRRHGRPIRRSGAVWPARKPCRRDGDISGLCAPCTAAHDGLHRSRPAIASRDQYRGDSQEAGPHRVPTRHRQQCSRRQPASQDHGGSRLWRAEFHDTGQWPDRAAP